MVIKPKRTCYARQWFNSRLEARWAVFFSAMKLKWKYEPRGEGTTPDFEFLLSGVPFNLEVKGSMVNQHYFLELQEAKVDLLALGGFYKNKVPRLLDVKHDDWLEFWWFFQDQGVMRSFQAACDFRFDLR